MTTTTTILHNVTIVDPEKREHIPDQSIVIDNGRITSVLPASEVDLTSAATVVQGQGHFAIPGMIDAHVHVRSLPHEGPSDANPTPRLAPEDIDIDDLESYEKRLHTYLYCGVTSLYDAGNERAAIFALRDAERNGRIRSPRIFCTGNLFTAPGGHGSSVAVEVSPEDDIPALVKAHLEYHPDVVKITYDEHNWGVRPLVPILEKETLARIITAVHLHGVKVTVHVSNELRAREAIAAGADILAHPVIQSPMTQEFADQLAKSRISVVSTLTIGDRYSRLADHPEYLDLPLYRDCESAAERTRLQTEESTFQKANRWADWMRVMTPIAQANLKMFIDAGGLLATGTDQSFGPDYHRELELLDAAGLSTWDILFAATTGAAAAIDQSGKLGTFEPGALADIVLLRDDPIAAIENLASIEHVVKGGQVIDRDALKIPANDSPEALVGAAALR